MNFGALNPVTRLFLQKHNKTLPYMWISSQRLDSVIIVIVVLHYLSCLGQFWFNFILLQEVYESFTKILSNVFSVSFLYQCVVFMKPLFEDEFFFSLGF